MTRRLIPFFVFCFLFSLLAGCDQLNAVFPKKSAKEGQTPYRMAVRGTVIAKVNNMPITLEELEEDTAAYNSMVPADRPEAKITTREQKLNYLKNELVRRVLLYQEAQAKGLDRKDEVIRALEKTKQDLLVVELVRQEAEKVDVSSAEIEDYYNTYKEQLKEPEERQLREIVVAGEQEAKDILIQLLQGADFATLARERSITASKKAGGDLGFIKRGVKSAQFDAVAFSDSLEVGRISSIFQGPGGYYILKLEAKRGGSLKPLSEMWDDIKRGLTFLKQQQKIEDLVGRLSREAKLEFYESEIK
ncbi:MAG: peptidyl-prolyl cis-trans isomerase [Candidatus Omnitrophota bacterium]|jgi:parvulin-like peptidyl-prolyl isomerase